MTGPSLDLDALREAIAEFRLCPDDLDDELALVMVWALRAVDRETRAVLALVDEQRKEIERLREALTRIKAMDNGDTTFYQERFWQATDIAHKALAGFPAENKEPS